MRGNLPEFNRKLARFPAIRTNRQPKPSKRKPCSARFTPAQRLIGSGFPLTFVAEAGLRHGFAWQWAVEVMSDFAHITNAFVASGNGGVNATGEGRGGRLFFPSFRPSGRRRELPGRAGRGCG